MKKWTIPAVEELLRRQTQGKLPISGLVARPFAKKTPLRLYLRAGKEGKFRTRLVRFVPETFLAEIKDLGRGGGWELRVVALIDAKQLVWTSFTYGPIITAGVEVFGRYFPALQDLRRFSSATLGTLFLKKVQGKYCYHTQERFSLQDLPKIREALGVGKTQKTNAKNS